MLAKTRVVRPWLVRNTPVGIISLASDNSKLRIPNGTAMLLRVNAVSRD